MRGRRQYVDLSPAELEVAKLQAEGLTGNEIAARLRKSYYTVKLQLQSARKKTGARNQIELANALRASATSTELSSPTAGLANLSVATETGTQPKERMEVNA